MQKNQKILINEDIILSRICVICIVLNLGLENNGSNETVVTRKGIFDFVDFSLG